MNGPMKKATPPPVDRWKTRRTKHDHEAFVAQAKESPGEWFLAMEGVSPAYAGLIRRGKIAAYEPAGSFEAVTRDMAKYAPNKRADVYLRYVG